MHRYRMGLTKIIHLQENRSKWGKKAGRETWREEEWCVYFFMERRFSNSKCIFVNRLCFPAGTTRPVDTAHHPHVTDSHHSAAVTSHCWSSPREEVKYKGPKVYKLKIENLNVFFSRSTWLCLRIHLLMPHIKFR